MIDPFAAVPATPEQHTAFLEIQGKKASTGSPKSDYQGEGDGNAPPANPDHQSDEDTIRYLASLKPLEYERARKEYATAMNCRPAILDAAVKSARNESEASRLPFAEVEPYHRPIDPAQVLSDVSTAIRQFIILDQEQADAAALWIAFTWFIDAVEVAPLAIITAPEKSCGKSQMLAVLGRLVSKPLPASNATAAGLFRAVELWKPTVLIDEADTFIRENDELKGLVNAGHTRANAYVLRVVGDNHEPKLFTVWGAKAFAGIALEKHLPDATMSRAIIFELRRKLPHETVTRLRNADTHIFDRLTPKLARFAADHYQQVQSSRPKLPEQLSDRAQDNWDPLLAVAECAGPEWVQRATTAALKLSGKAEKAVSTGNELLADIQQIFESKKVDKITTTELITELIADDEKSWATYNRGKALSPRQLARQLSGYEIASKNIRIGYFVSKGFEIDQFTDAFARYLSSPADLELHTLQPPKANNGTPLRVADNALHEASTKTSVTHPATLKPAPTLACSGVADKTPIFEVPQTSNSKTSIRI